MSMSRIFVSLVLLCAITVSCKEDTLVSPIAIPEIVDTSMDINGTDIVLSGKVSDGDRIKECGFYFGRSEDEMEKLSSDLLVGKEFTVTLKGMAEPGNMYFCRSFIVAGEDTMTSGLNSIKADYRPPIVTIDSLKSSGLIVEDFGGVPCYSFKYSCYYTISENFSGELFAIGLCWGTSESPTINSSKNDYFLNPDYCSKVYNNNADTDEHGCTLYFRAYAVSNVGVTYSNEVYIDIPNY